MYFHTFYFHYEKMDTRCNMKTVLVIVMLLLHYCTARARKRRFDGTDVPNDVLIEEFEVVPAMPGYRRIDYVIESNTIPEVKPVLPSEIVSEMSTRLKTNGYDPYFIEDLYLKVPSKSIYGNRLTDVVLDQGVVVGMSDFRHHIEDSKKLPQDSMHLLLIWTRLRAHYRVTVDHDGLKSVSEMDMDIGRLFMDVLAQKAYNKLPRIQMSKVTDIKTELRDLDALSDDLKTSIILEVEFRVKNLFHSRILNILLRHMKDILNRNSEENMLSSFYSALR